MSPWYAAIARTLSFQYSDCIADALFIKRRNAVLLENIAVVEATAQIAVARERLPASTLDVVAQRLPYRDEEPRRRMHDALEQASMLA